MTDDLERTLAASLRGAAAGEHDAAAAAGRFSGLRAARLRTRRTAGAAAIGVLVAAGALAPTLGRNLGSGGDDRVGLAGSPTASASVDEAPSPEATTTEETTPSMVPSVAPASQPAVKESPAPPPTLEPNPSPTAPVPSPTPEVDEQHTATAEDDGKTYTLRVGDGLVILLDGDESFRWSPLVISDTSVLYGESGDAGGGDQSWKTVGRKAGRVTVSSTQDPACRNATPPCGAPSRSWQITVVVTA